MTATPIEEHVSDLANLDDLTTPSDGPHVFMHAGRVLLSVGPEDAETVASVLEKFHDLKVDLGFSPHQEQWSRTVVWLRIAARAATKHIPAPEWVPFRGVAGLGDTPRNGR